MITFKKPAPSYQKMYEQALDVHSVSHPVQKEIDKSVGTINFSAIITEDKTTLDVLSNIPGLVCFLCTLKANGIIFSEGRSATVINGVNKYFSKSISFCRNQALLDAVAKSTKYLEVLNLDPKPQNSGVKLKLDESYQVREVENSDSITDKQKNYLLTLIKTNVAENKRGEMRKQIDSYTRNQASQLIKTYVSSN